MGKIITRFLMIAVSAIFFGALSTISAEEAPPTLQEIIRKECGRAPKPLKDIDFDFKGLRNIVLGLHVHHTLPSQAILDATSATYMSCVWAHDGTFENSQQRWATDFIICLGVKERTHDTDPYGACVKAVPRPRAVVVNPYGIIVIKKQSGPWGTAVRNCTNEPTPFRILTKPGLRVSGDTTIFGSVRSAVISLEVQDSNRHWKSLGNLTIQDQAVEALPILDDKILIHVTEVSDCSINYFIEDRQD